MELASEQNRRQIRAIKLKYQRNLRGFWELHKYRLYILVAAATLDCLSTIHFMLLTGPERELHPHIRIISSFLGPIAGPVLGKVLQLVLGVGITVYVRKYARLILISASVLYLYAFWHNLYMMDFF
jgi:hypothetical protein